MAGLGPAIFFGNPPLMEFAPLFSALSAAQLAFLACAYVFGFVVKGFFGYGAVPPMILAGSLLMPPHHAVLLAGLINALSQVFLLPDGLRHGSRKMAGRMLLLVIPGLVVGVLVFKELSSERLQLVVGLIILLLVFLDGPALRPYLEPLVRAWPRAFGAGAATIAGMLAGIVGAGGMIFLSTYLRFWLTERMQFRGTIILIVTGLLATRTALLFGTGLVTTGLLFQALMFAPIGMVGSLVGGWLSRRVSNTSYFKAYRAFLIVAALLLTLRAMF